MSAAKLHKDCSVQDSATHRTGFFTKFVDGLKKYNDRPFPWCLAPDWLWSAFGMALLVFISVPGISMIMCTEVSAWLLFPLKKTPIGTKVHKAVSDFIEKISKRLGAVVLLDERDWSYLPWTIIEATALPALCYFFAYRRWMDNGFEWWVPLIYHFCRLGPKYIWFSHHHVLIHKEGHCHKGFFKGPFVFFNCINSLWTGFFYGSMYQSYAAGHNKVHHRWHNDVDDVATNIDIDRTGMPAPWNVGKPGAQEAVTHGMWSYVLYLPRFFLLWTGVSHLALFLKRSEYKLAFDTLTGQVWWALGMYVITNYAGFMFTLIYFVYPMGESIAFLGSMAYLWHSFVDPENPSDVYVNSITILDGHDNIWNEDYHVVHHHAPFVHWSDVPAHYEKTKHRYAEVTASIFRDCEEGTMIYWIFAHKWDLLASHFVDLNNKLSHEEIKALLQRRLKWHCNHGFHQSTAANGAEAWGAAEVRDWDTVSKEDQDNAAAAAAAATKLIGIDKRTATNSKNRNDIHAEKMN